MRAHTQGELRVESAVSIENIKEFHMKIQKGEHSHVFLSGEIPEEKGEATLWQKLEQTDLKILIKDEPVFAGIIRTVEIKHDGKGYLIFIYGSSATVLIDYEKKNRTFQDINRTYKQIMQEVLEDTKGASLKFHKEDIKINAPVYQIEETDWEFIKRLASHIQMPVQPLSLLQTPALTVGFSEGKTHGTENKEVVCEKIWFDREKNSIYRQIRGYENWNTGERISWEGRIYFITEKSCRLEKGLLYFRYTIENKESFMVKRYDNPQFIGRMLSASVIDTRNEEVKVKFDMDKQQNKENAYWYPWRPDVGNVMYCMPEKGEKIYINLGDSSGEKVRAVCGVHKNGAGNPEMKAADRCFTTMDKKRMSLTSETVEFKDLKQKNPLEIILNDNKGTNVTSNHKLVISARDTIGIKGNNIFLQAPKEVSIVRRDSAFPTVINLCNGFDSIGATSEVRASGNGEADFPVFHETRQETGKEYSLEGVEKNIIASTPRKGFMGELERQIEGIKVDKVTGENIENC